MAKVLYLDDDDAVRRATKFNLEIDHDVDAVLVKNGQVPQQTMLDIEAGKYEIIVSDYNWGSVGDNGVSFAKKVRLKNKDIPIILVSAEEERSIRAKEPDFDNVKLTYCDKSDGARLENLIAQAVQSPPGQQQGGTKGI